jgi:hypothetical protein
LVGRYSNVVLRKVDIVDWKSEAWQQAQAESNPRGIPFVRVYGTGGDLLGETGGNIAAIEELVRKEAQ